MTENIESAEVVEKTDREKELEAQLAALKSAAYEPKNEVEQSTRDRSPVKPQDHKPAKGEIVDVHFMGSTFKVIKGSLTRLSTMDLLEQGMVSTALAKLVGRTAYSEFLEKNPEADEKTAGELLEAIAEATEAGK